MSHRRQSFCLILSESLLLSRRPDHARESAWGDENRPQLSVALTVPRLLQLLHHGRSTFSTDCRRFLFKNPDSALKGGVNVCQRQLVNEVRGPLVTEFVRNFGREDATPYQRS